jgi:hypothetical protein
LCRIDRIRKTATCECSRLDGKVTFFKRRKKLAAHPGKYQKTHPKQYDGRSHYDEFVTQRTADQWAISAMEKVHHAI